MKRLLPLLAALLVGCSGDTVPFAVTFPAEIDILAGAPVREDDERIGRVSVVRVRQGRTILHLEIEPSRAARVTTRSEFRLGREGRGAEGRFVELISRDGPPAPAESEFSGALGLGDVAEQLFRDFGRAIEDAELQQELEEAEARLREIADEGRASWDRLRPELEREAENLLREAEERGGDAADAVRRELERLLEELEAATDDGPI